MVATVVAIIIEQKSCSWRQVSIPRTVNVVNTDRLGTTLSPNLSLARRSPVVLRMPPAATSGPSRMSSPTSWRLVDVHGGDLLELVGHGVVCVCVQIATATLCGE
jgi:hypothetical protein